MGERVVTIVIYIFLGLALPFLITICINGGILRSEKELENVSTGKDIIICGEDGNRLVDVEVYVAGVLPGLIDYKSKSELIEAQAVAVRTGIYYKMGDATVINANELNYTYYDDTLYSEKFGDNYRKAKRIYDTATYNTIGQTIK